MKIYQQPSNSILSVGKLRRGELKIHKMRGLSIYAETSYENVNVRFLRRRRSNLLINGLSRGV